MMLLFHPISHSSFMRHFGFREVFLCLLFRSSVATLVSLQVTMLDLSWDFSVVPITSCTDLDSYHAWHDSLIEHLSSIELLAYLIGHIHEALSLSHLSGIFGDLDQIMYVLLIDKLVASSMMIFCHCYTRIHSLHLI